MSEWVSQSWVSPVVVVDDPERWRDFAACYDSHIQTGEELFFSEQPSCRASRVAKWICGRCQVKAECLEYSIVNEERFGIWGGTDQRERRKLIRQRKIADGNVSCR